MRASPRTSQACIIRFETEPKNETAYAADEPGAMLTTVREQATAFPEIRDAHNFLWRHGFMRRSPRSSTGYGLKPMPSGFSSWEIEFI